MVISSLADTRAGKIEQPTTSLFLQQICTLKLFGACLR